MDRDQFYALYGKALAGEETWGQAAKNAAETLAKPTTAQGSGQVSHDVAKSTRARVVANPTASQADTVDTPPPEAKQAPMQLELGPQSASLGNAREMTPEEKAQFLEQRRPQDRVPLYTQAGGAKKIGLAAAGLGGLPGAAENLANLRESPFVQWMNEQPVGSQLANLVPGVLPAKIAGIAPQAGALDDIGREAAFQFGPMYDDAAAAARKVRAMFGGG